MLSYMNSGPRETLQIGTLQLFIYFQWRDLP
jgi:hypothetical protein